MIEKFINDLKGKLPLTIRKIEWDEITFKMIGPDWTFTTRGSWRITKRNVMLFGCFDPAAYDIAKILKDESIVDLAFQNNTIKIDLIFILSDDKKIEIFSTDSDEPWSFFLEGFDNFEPKPIEYDLYKVNF